MRGGYINRRPTTSEASVETANAILRNPSRALLVLQTMMFAINGSNPSERATINEFMVQLDESRDNQQAVALTFRELFKKLREWGEGAVVPPSGGDAEREAAGLAQHFIASRVRPLQQPPGQGGRRRRKTNRYGNKRRRTMRRYRK